MHASLAGLAEADELAIVEAVVVWMPWTCVIGPGPSTLLMAGFGSAVASDIVAAMTQ